MTCSLFFPPPPLFPSSILLPLSFVSLPFPSHISFFFPHLPHHTPPRFTIIVPSASPFRLASLLHFHVLMLVSLYPIPDLFIPIPPFSPVLPYYLHPFATTTFSLHSLLTSYSLPHSPPTHCLPIQYYLPLILSLPHAILPITFHYLSSPLHAHPHVPIRGSSRRISTVP